MKSLFRSAPLWLALGLAHGAAVASPGDALRAADPGTPVPPMHLALPDAQRLDAPDLPGDLAQALAAWREANARVADFPRGHIDLLRWEKAQPAPSRADGPASADPMDFGEALRASMRLRPDLFTHRDMGPLERARVRVAYAAHVRELRHAWIDAVAQGERARLAAAVLDATRAGSELGRRMVRAGNWPHARLMQEQAIEAQAWQAANDATVAAHGATERLARPLGLWRANEVAALATRLPSTLPALPPSIEAPRANGIEAAAVDAHPLLAIERAQAERSLRGVSAERWADWSAAQDAALAAMPEPRAGQAEPPHLDDPRLLRDPRLLEADGQRANLLRGAAERRSMAREAWLTLHARHAGAQHAERVVRELRAPLQQESLQRYNGMLDSTWQLLASAREHSAALDAALLARRDFWRADASWDALLAGADFNPGTPSAAAPAKGSATAGH